MLKKRYPILIKITSIFMILAFAFTPVIHVEAKTVRDVRNDLEKLQRDSQETNTKINYTNSQIKTAEKTIEQLRSDVQRIAAETAEATKKIDELGAQIEQKREEIKKIVSFTQISNGDSIYMDYISGAESMTDFIYRISISEQLAEYNDELIKDMNTMIKELDAKKIDLKNKEEETKQKQQEISKNLVILGQQKQELAEYNVSLADEIKTAKEILNMYIQAGCKDSDDIRSCGVLPPDTRFWRPITRGHVASLYGMRLHPIYHDWRPHDGVDLNDYSERRVFAAANGKVATVGYDSSRGNYIYIYHNIKNVKYTTTYLHLKSGSILVRAGDVVTKDTQIATMGTTGDSTGVHLHFSLATGFYGIDYVFYNTTNGDCFLKHTVNPIDYVNFPSSQSTYWTNRTTMYY